MPGLWKAWKAKGRLPPLSTSPLGISPKAGEIPTFPQLRRRRRMEKCKTKNRFFTFPPPRIYICLKKQTTRPRAGFALRAAAGALRRTRGKKKLSSIRSKSCRQCEEIVDAGHDGYRHASGSRD